MMKRLLIKKKKLIELVFVSLLPIVALISMFLGGLLYSKPSICIGFIVGVLCFCIVVVLVSTNNRLPKNESKSETIWVALSSVKLFFSLMVLSVLLSGPAIFLACYIASPHEWSIIHILCGLFLSPACYFLAGWAYSFLVKIEDGDLFSKIEKDNRKQVAFWTAVANAVIVCMDIDGGIFEKTCTVLLFMTPISGYFFDIDKLIMGDFKETIRSFYNYIKLTKYPIIVLLGNALFYLIAKKASSIDNNTLYDVYSLFIGIYSGLLMAIFISYFVNRRRLGVNKKEAP